MAVNAITISHNYPDGTNITVVGDDATDVVTAFQSAYALLNYKPDPVPTPDPPV